MQSILLNNDVLEINKEESKKKNNKKTYNTKKMDNFEWWIFGMNELLVSWMESVGVWAFLIIR